MEFLWGKNFGLIKWYYKFFVEEIIFVMLKKIYIKSLGFILIKIFFGYYIKSIKIKVKEIWVGVY